jgi:hypothetical protein
METIILRPYFSYKEESLRYLNKRINKSLRSSEKKFLMRLIYVVSRDGLKPSPLGDYFSNNVAWNTEEVVTVCTI